MHRVFCALTTIREWLYPLYIILTEGVRSLRLRIEPSFSLRLLLLGRQKTVSPDEHCCKDSIRWLPFSLAMTSWWHVGETSTNRCRLLRFLCVLVIWSEKLYFLNVKGLQIYCLRIRCLYKSCRTDFSFITSNTVVTHANTVVLFYKKIEIYILKINKYLAFTLVVNRWNFKVR